MNAQEARREETEVGERIRALARRKGWSVAELARRAGLKRQTLHRLQRGETRRPQIATLHKLARALEVPVEQLCDEPSGSSASEEDGPIPPSNLSRENRMRRRFDRETNPGVAEVAEESPELFFGWTEETWDELYSTFGTGGALNRRGVTETARRINRKRKTLEQLEVLLETHLADVAARMVGTLYEMVVPDAGTDRRSEESDESGAAS